MFYNLKIEPITIYPSERMVVSACKFKRLEMIKLKNEINKSATMRELRKEAEKGYERSWQPELQVEAFMKGAEALLNLLHLPRVIKSVCKCENSTWNQDAGCMVCDECGEVI